ncbi:MATN2 [Branchiostoma lanceolatum]|uniref:MATN2 protein n=1 Tax=Branchiostoma lanceolatum TaxID=7740 RepID=A0A8J9WHK3_BRALA|nr:MATN2 [Branchiostoma lanceolatum]
MWWKRLLFISTIAVAISGTHGGYFGCIESPTFPGDGFDNDCDLRVDEEIENGIDDDGDGLIDEDLRFCVAPQNVPGDQADNDCDGLIDEEIEDGIDNDGDGRIDEDLYLCIESPAWAGDGKDNDCDGRVDEESQNGEDDDGDGLIDEDTSTCFAGKQRYGDGVDNDCDGRVDEEVQNGIDDDRDGLIDEDMSSCFESVTHPDDGLDNDCDYRVDEELPNGLDDDGDGRIDEDVVIGPPGCAMDLVFVLDGSWSIGEIVFDEIKQYILETIEFLETDNYNVGVAVMTYGGGGAGTCVPEMSITLGGYGNQTELANYITTSVNFTGGLTPTTQAMYTMQRRISYRENMTRVGVIFTDGRAQSSVSNRNINETEELLAEAVEEALGDGFEMYSVGASIVDAFVKLDGLSLLTNSTDRVLIFRDHPPKYLAYRIRLDNCVEEEEG